MSKIPPLKPRKVARVLEAAGFELRGQKGSHQQWKKGALLVTLPNNPGEEIKKGTLSSIIRQMGISRAEFIKYLNE